MIDQKTEYGIKAVKDFIEFWTKFHSMYAGILSRGIITKEDEERFLETKRMMGEKYAQVSAALDLKYMPCGRTTDPVGDVLMMGSIRFVSEDNLKKLDNDWKYSYIFLNNILERLKNKKRRLEDFSTVGVFFKRVLERIQ